MFFSIVETKTVPTVQAQFKNKKVFLHSKYNPLAEASIWVKKESTRIKTNSPILVIGLGAGYHIQQLAEAFPTHQIIVLEFNEKLFNWFPSSIFSTAVSNLCNVELQLGSALPERERKQLFKKVHLSNILIHKSGLDLLPEEFSGIKIALENLKMQQRSLQVQGPRLIENFKQNLLLQDNGIRGWKNKFEGRPMILVSAGPSLDKQLPLLKKIFDEGYFIIGAVGTAIKPLLKAEIIPNFFSIIDPNPATLEQLEYIELPTTPLFYLSSAYFKTVSYHRGPKFIVYQEGFPLAEEHANKVKEPLIKTGGSVATALLDLIVYFGGEIIALIGQDLAYTGGKTHANSTHNQQDIIEGENLRYTLAYNRQTKVATAQNLLLYKKWLENYARNHPSLTLLNCTEGGAYIENWKHTSFEDFYKEYKPDSVY